MLTRNVFYLETHTNKKCETKTESSKAKAEVVLSKNLASLLSSSREALIITISLTRCVFECDVIDINHRTRADRRLFKP